jgi:hypothetical protein
LIAIEDIPFYRFDPYESCQGVQEYTQKINFTKDDLKKVDTQIEVEVHDVLQFALGIA